MTAPFVRDPAAGRHLIASTQAVRGFLDAYGDDLQRSMFLRPFTEVTDTYALAFTERDAGSDLSQVQTAVVIENDTLILNGSKVSISGLDVASHIAVLARSGDTPLALSPCSIVLVPRNAAGVDVLWTKTMDGARLADLALREVRLPAVNRIGAFADANELGRLAGFHESRDGAQLLAAFMRLLPKLEPQPESFDRLATAYIGAKLLAAMERREDFRAGDKRWARPLLLLAAANQRRLTMDVIPNIASPAAWTDGAISDLVARDLLQAPGTAIANGTPESLKELIAERVFGFERETASRGGECRLPGES